MDISQLGKTGFALTNITCGNSMRPLIWGGQHCVAVTPLEGEPTVGDILIFRHPRFKDRQAYIVHRLVEIRQEGGERVYVTRGDNCLGCETLSRGEILGRVAEVHRMSGFRPWHVIPARRFAVTGRAFAVYSRIWMALWPVRRVYYSLRGRMARWLQRRR